MGHRPASRPTRTGQTIHTRAANHRSTSRHGRRHADVDPVEPQVRGRRPGFPPPSPRPCRSQGRGAVDASATAAPSQPRRAPARVTQMGPARAQPDGRRRRCTPPSHVPREPPQEHATPDRTPKPAPTRRRRPRPAALTARPGPPPPDPGARAPDPPPHRNPTGPEPPLRPASAGVRHHAATAAAPPRTREPLPKPSPSRAPSGSRRRTTPRRRERGAAPHPASTASPPRTAFGGRGRRHRGETSGSGGGEPPGEIEPAAR